MLIITNKSTEALLLSEFIDKLEESRRDKTEKIKYGVNQLS